MDEEAKRRWTCHTFVRYVIPATVDQFEDLVGLLEYPTLRRLSYDYEEQTMCAEIVPEEQAALEAILTQMGME